MTYSMFYVMYTHEVIGKSCIELGIRSVVDPVLLFLQRSVTKFVNIYVLVPIFHKYLIKVLVNWIKVLRTGLF